MAALFNFEVHTPHKRFFDGKAEIIVLTLEDGEIGIYAKHSPFIAVTVSCLLHIKDAKGIWKTAFVTNGILEVKEYKNVLVVDIAEWPEEIDKDSVLAAKRQAEETLNNKQFKFEVDKAREELRCAELRLKLLERSKANA